MARRITFPDLLAEIPAAADILIEHLVSGACLKSAREACKPFCTYIDENIKDLQLLLGEQDLARWSQKHHPLLVRWPSCTSLSLALDPADGGAGDSLASLTALPFVGLGLEARRRITEVYAEVAAPEEQPGVDREQRWNAGVIAVTLAAYLPNLRSFILNSATGLLFTPAHQRLLYQGLSAMENLEQLCLPVFPALDQIEILAGQKLKDLQVSEESAAPLTRQNVDSVSRLQHLQSLGLTGFRLEDPVNGPNSPNAAASLSYLLDNLPPSLKELKLWEFHAGAGYRDDIYFSMDAGRIAKVEARSEDNSIPPVAAVCILAKELLASHAMAGAARLQELYVEATWVPHEQCLKPSALVRPLRELLGRCDVVRVNQLHVGTVGAALPAVDLLGKPTLLNISMSEDEVVLTLRTGTEPLTWADKQQPSPHSKERRSGTQPQQQQQPCSLPGPDQPSVSAAVPSTEEVAQRVTRWLIGAAPAAAAAGSGGPAGASSGSAACGSSGGGPVASGAKPGSGSDVAAASGLDDYSSGLLLLSGNFVTLLAKMPDSVPVWLKGLSCRGSGTSSTGGGDKTIKAYHVLPEPMGAVLLQCDTGAGAATAAATVRSVASGRAGGELQVAPVVHPTPRKCEAVDLAKCTYVDAVGKVLQDIWDERHASGAAAALGEKELLRQLMERVRELGGELKSGEL